MLMKWPGRLEAGQVFDGTTSSLDVFPTACAAAGIELPDAVPLDGVDLEPYLNGELAGAPHETLFWSSGPNKAVRHGDWKLIESGDSKWLYDLATDVGELNDLKDSELETLKELESLWREWRGEMSPPAWPSKPQRRKVTIDGGSYEVNI